MAPCKSGLLPEGLPYINNNIEIEIEIEIKAIEIVKTHSHTMGQREADLFAIVHERVNSIYRIELLLKRELTRLAGLTHLT